MAKKRDVNYSDMSLQELDMRYKKNNKLAITALFITLGVLAASVCSIAFFTYGLLVPKIIAYSALGISSIADLILVVKGKKDYNAIIKEYEKRGLLENDNRPNIAARESVVEKVKLEEVTSGKPQLVEFVSQDKGATSEDAKENQ